MSSLEGKKILIADDSAYIRKTIIKIVEAEGMIVIGEAENGIDAIERFNNLKPDVITMDIVMPKMTGLEALKTIIETDPDAQIIMVSSLGREDKVMEAIDNGAQNFIVKPINKNKLLDILKSLFS